MKRKDVIRALYDQRDRLVAEREELMAEYDGEALPRCVHRLSGRIVGIIDALDLLEGE